MNILVTGSKGFIGKNLVNFIKDNYDHEIFEFNSGENLKLLESIIRKTDFIIHLAGVNRPKYKTLFREVNINLPEYISSLLKDNSLQTPIIFSSSIQASLKNDYGLSKLKAEQIFYNLNKLNNNPVIIYRLPGVFGKWCKPNYNSVVSTFCYNSINNIDLKIDDPNKEISLVYVDDLVKNICEFFNKENKGLFNIKLEPEYKISLKDLAKKILTFHTLREKLFIENVGIGFDRKLYATYISFLKENQFSYPLKEYIDERGKFIEVLKNINSGQIAYFTAKVGITRGGHYHNTKSEKFIVVHGKAKFAFKNLITGKEIEIYADSDNPRVVDSIPGWIHNITNIGNTELKVLLWSSEVFDKSKPDTYQKDI